MNLNSMSRILLAIVLSLSLIATGLQCAVNQRGTGRSARAHPDGTEHRGPGGDAAVRKATDSRRSSGDPEHFGGSQNLPALLQAAHINNPALSTRIMAAVNLILTTVGSFAALIPQGPTAVPKTARQNAVIPHPNN